MTEQREPEVSPSGGEVAISVRNLSKEFKVYARQAGANDTTSSYTRGLSSILGRTKYQKIQVLKDVSFDVMKGEMVGILGRNGAGKSTLLKIIAGIIEPTKGSVKVNGIMTSLLGFQAGLNKKLTARENIVQYGLVLGLSKGEVLERVDEVLEFAELEDFADVQISHFSSGMNARLAFSTSMLVNPDILLLDEILAVGDYYFHQKSIKIFENIRKNKGTIILVSHSLGNIKQYCDRAMLLHDGRIELIGEPKTIIKKYLSMGLSNDKKTIQEQQKTDRQNTESLSGILDSAIVDPDATDATNSAIEDTLPSTEIGLTEAPVNLFPDDSPFLAGMLKKQIKGLRWRAKMLIEDNDFALKDKTILDLRCQNGQFMYAALKAGAKYVEGIEKQKELIEIAQENLQYHDISANKYKIIQGNMLATLRRVKPGEFDTVLCIGVLNKLINHAGLLRQIVRIKPSYLVIDASINDSSETIMELDTDSNEELEPENNDSRNEERNIGLPSKSAIELLLKTNKFKFEYIDWNKTNAMDGPIQDYMAGRRIAIIARLE